MSADQTAETIEKNGIHYRVKKEGSGTKVRGYEDPLMLYTGWLEDGTEFDSNQDRENPFSFTLGVGMVIPGWDIGVEGMAPGEVRELLIPAELAYGPQGAGDVIPPNANLRFEVELVGVRPSDYENIDNQTTQEMLERGVPVVDIRRKDEWEKTGIIDGVTTLTFFEQGNQVNPLFPGTFEGLVKPEDEVIVLCRSGARSRYLARLLTERMGYQKVFNVDNGMLSWLDEDRPVVPYKED